MKTVVTIIALLHVVRDVASACSTHYGAQPCRFVPAPPGGTPPCARPGSTYCEHPTDYPGQVIQHLVDNWEFDHSTVFTNEDPVNFGDHRRPPGYGRRPNSVSDYFPLDDDDESTNSGYEGSSYIPPPDPQHPVNYSDGFAGYPDRRPAPSQVANNNNNQLPAYGGRYDMLRAHLLNQLHYYERIATPPPVSHYDPNDWWKRPTRAERGGEGPRRAQRRRRWINREERLHEARNAIVRAKRQNALTGETLCQTRSQYIMPRAAINSKGNWMYIVNMPELDSRLTQLVKSETCVSQQCSGICSLPNGYTSKCEQKYVQKRLVALEGTGNQLYTDVFWFPSCCVCTISK